MVIKKSSCLIALIFIVFSCNVYSMKRLREEKTWIEMVGEILLDEANIQDLVGFTNMPPEVLERIIYLLSANVAAQSLEDVARNINNLVLVNTQLNELINHPSFCLHLIKHLSQKFNCSDETVARALQTKEAQRRLELQAELYHACLLVKSSVKDLDELFLKGADINFIYKNNEALLIEVYISRRNNYIDIIRWFIDKKVDKKIQNRLLKYMIESFLEYGRLGKDELDIIKILLNADVDPEITGFEGLSMLSLMQSLLDQSQASYGQTTKEEDIDNIKKVIEMLNDAIKRKQQTNQKK